MDHLFATTANDAEYMPALMFALRGQLRVPDRASPHETWGVGYFAEDRALIVRKPATLLEERTAYGVAPDLRSRIVMACARPEKSQADAPPFRFRRWMFAYAGDVDAFGSLQAKVASRLPDFVQDVLGDGHGGRLVHALFLTELHRGGVLEDPLVDPMQIAAGLDRTAETLARLGPEAGIRGLDASFVASNGRVLAVTRAGRALWTREVVGLENLPEGPVDETLHDFKRIAEALRRFRGRVIASDVLESEQGGWEELGRVGSAIVDGASRLRPLVP